MIELRVACDGGKDSLSMAAAAGGETVMAPGNLVVSAYVGCPDVTKVVTPDLVPGRDGGVLLHVDLGRGRRRLGGSALAQAHAQLGDESPDVAAADLGAAWRGVQAAIDARLVRAGHDVSDGGVVTALLEMAFAGEWCFFDARRGSARDARRDSETAKQQRTNNKAALLESLACPIHFHPWHGQQRLLPPKARRAATPRRAPRSGGAHPAALFFTTAAGPGWSSARPSSSFVPVPFFSIARAA
jgi:hypothetical protein